MIHDEDISDRTVLIIIAIGFIAAGVLFGLYQWAVRAL